MKTRTIFMVGIIIIALFVSGVYLYDELNEEEVVEVTLEEKLANATFNYQDGYYVRDIVQEDGTYTEALNIEENNFMRTVTDESDKEVYNYNYIDNTFTYLYYFEDELIMKVVYDYTNGAVTEDEDNQYENLAVDIDSLKEYFNKLLTDNELEVSEL